MLNFCNTIQSHCITLARGNWMPYLINRTLRFWPCWVPRFFQTLHKTQSWLLDAKQSYTENFKVTRTEPCCNRLKSHLSYVTDRMHKVHDRCCSLPLRCLNLRCGFFLSRYHYTGKCKTRLRYRWPEPRAPNCSDLPFSSAQASVRLYGSRFVTWIGHVLK
jgi:hypothetical protein